MNDIPFDFFLLMGGLVVFSLVFVTALLSRILRSTIEISWATVISSYLWGLTVSSGIGICFIVMDTFGFSVPVIVTMDDIIVYLPVLAFAIFYFVGVNIYSVLVDLEIGSLLNILGDRLRENRTAIYFYVLVHFSYTLFLMVTGYIQASIIYHFVIMSLPLVLLILKMENEKTLCLSLGNIKEGIQYTVIFFVFMTIFSIIRVVFYQNYRFILPQDIFVFIIYVLYGPLSEELFHRGYMQSKYGLKLSSLSFALSHLPKMILAPYAVMSDLGTPILNAFYLDVGIGSLIHPIYYFTFKNILYILYFLTWGYLFGIIRRETKSVYYPMIIHGLINFFSISIICVS